MRTDLLNPIIHAKQLLTDIQRNGTLGGIRQWVGKRYSYLRYTIPGNPIFEQDWDVLVVVDACRLDLIQRVSSDFEFISAISNTNSTGSSTQEWMETNFITDYNEEMAQTRYVCGNPHSRNFIPTDQFAAVDEVWEYAWNDNRGTVLPRPITDRAIHTARHELKPNERLIIHYMQPHIPFVGSNQSAGLELSNYGEDHWAAGKDDWALLQRGVRSKEELWQDYEENLRLVLNDIGMLIENIDAEKLIITSDHGNAIGESWMTGHPTNVPHPVLRSVPWIELSTEDSHTHEPGEYDQKDRTTGESVAKRLEMLGYK
jgi:hypothetical protein